jgi:hypothetical protein
VELLYSSSSGNQATLLSGTYSEIVATKKGIALILDTLNIKENNATTYTMISDKVTVPSCSIVC